MVLKPIFGKARPQTIPCDSSIQTEDLSASLNSADAYAFGSVVGNVLYLARDRPDLLFTVKELSASMSNPTLTAVARLRKLVGYLKTTSGFCMMLDMPVGGQGKLKATEKHWILESYSDSDWSGHQAHRRSTSCGLHMLNGSFVYASSRTQRVVSLSSCEAELHSMVSCLCDGIYRKRCIQFVMNCQVENYLLVDSSSARQIALRLGPGKLKHVAGRILWIQQAVAEGSVQLAQVGTTWILSDLGTQPLGGNWLRLLLHEINMSSDQVQLQLERKNFNFKSGNMGQWNMLVCLQNKLRESCWWWALGLPMAFWELQEVFFLMLMLLKVCNNVHSSPMIRVCNPRAFHGASFAFAFLCFCWLVWFTSSSSCTAWSTKHIHDSTLSRLTSLCWNL